MFELYTIIDEVILVPSELGNFNLSIENKIKQRILNKVIANEGICIAIKSIKVMEKIVVVGEGTVQSKVQINCVLFRPLLEEILEGKVTHQNEYGIFAIVGCAPVYIPSENLMKPSFFDTVEKKWLWRFEQPDKSFYDLYYEDQQQIKMRVKELNFSKDYQSRIKLSQSQHLTSIQDHQFGGVNELEGQDQSIQAHFVIGSCEEECLGMKSWW